MYIIGSAGPDRADGGRTDGGRVSLNDSTIIFIVFYETCQNTLCFSVASHPAGAQVPIFIPKMENASNKDAKSIGFLTFQIRRSRKYRLLLFKHHFLGTSPDPADLPEMEHQLQLATCCQRARGNRSLSKVPDTMTLSCY